MSLTSQVRRLILRVEETLDIDVLSERAVKASRILESVREQLPPRAYEKLRTLLELTEFRGENNYFAGHYH